MRRHNACSNKAVKIENKKHREGVSNEDFKRYS